eukprot:3939746-Rhodomonas_salina.1
MSVGEVETDEQIAARMHQEQRRGGGAVLESVGDGGIGCDVEHDKARQALKDSKECEDAIE